MALINDNFIKAKMKLLASKKEVCVKAVKLVNVWLNVEFS